MAINGFPLIILATNPLSFAGLLSVPWTPTRTKGSTYLNTFVFYFYSLRMMWTIGLRVRFCGNQVALHDVDSLITELFRVFDSDKNGRISRAEVRGIFAAADVMRGRARNDKACCCIYAVIHHCLTHCSRSVPKNSLTKWTQMVIIKFRVGSFCFMPGMTLLL
jgi:hypothetical protein